MRVKAQRRKGVVWVWVIILRWLVSEPRPERITDIKSFRFVDKDISVVVENLLNCLRREFKQKYVSLEKSLIKGKGRTIFWKDVSAMAPCPLLDARCPKSVGPKTIERFCMDMEFSAECWFILEKQVRNTNFPKIYTAALPMQVTQEVLQCWIVSIR